MSKIFTLREWLYLPDAVKYLSAKFNEDVTSGDLLNLAMDRRLVLSVRFEGMCIAIPAKLSDVRIEGKWGEQYIQARDGRYFHLADEVEYIEDIFDLPMIGGETQFVRQYEWRGERTGDPFMFSYDEIILRLSSGGFCVLVDRKKETVDDRNHGSAKNYTFKYDFPEDARLVVRTSSIRHLEESLNTPSQKDLSGKELRTYKNIVAAMLELLKTPRPGRNNDAAIIRELVENYGEKYGISESNLNRKLPDARRSLESD